jgi:hypothetical protein
MLKITTEPALRAERHACALMFAAGMSFVDQLLFADRTSPSSVSQGHAWPEETRPLLVDATEPRRQLDRVAPLGRNLQGLQGWQVR